MNLFTQRSRRLAASALAVAASLILAAPATASTAASPAASSAGSRASTAPAPASVRAALADLAQALTWRVDAATTYAAVVPAVRRAITVLERHRATLPGYAADRAALDRLKVEATYLRDLASAPGYQPGVLDSVMFLQGSVDEWRFRITTMEDRLTDPAVPAAPAGTSSAQVDARTAPGTVFRDVASGPDLVVVPGGSYVAGSTEEEHETWGVPVARRDFETPQRDVTIAEPLAFGRTEVTVAQFDAFVRETGYRPRGGARWWNPADPSAMRFDARLDYRDPGFAQTGDSPVVALTRGDAEAYAAWLSRVTGETYRLPTEDEWEWAARGGADTTFFWGDTLDEVGTYANTFDSTAKQANGFSWGATPATDGFAWTAPVASFRPNAFGLYDVTGNAREFTADSWVRDLSAVPGDGSVHDGGVPFPVLRGGAWNYQPQNLRLDYRSAYFSSEVATNMFGFRLVREL